MLYFRELRNSCFKVNLPFDSGQAFIDVRFIFCFITELCIVTSHVFSVAEPEDPHSELVKSILQILNKKPAEITISSLL